MILDGKWVIFVGCWFAVYIMAALDHTHGTHFVFPAPFCDKFNQVNGVVRWKYGARFRTVVTLYGTYKKFIQSMGEEFPQTPLPCKQLSMGRVTRSAAIIAVAKEDIMFYVQYKHDNFMVYPLNTLQNTYKIITVYPPEMDRTFVVITAPIANTKLEVTMAPYLSGFVEYNELHYHAGEIIHVTLNRNDVLMLSCACDLSGSEVDSTAKIVVVTGSYRDHWDKQILIEQSFPNSAWGRNFVLPIEDWMSEIIRGLEISTENSTILYPTITGMLSYPVEADEYLTIHSTSSIHVVFHIRYGDSLDVTEKPILTNGVPIEQYPKFLCSSYSSPYGSTCFVSVGNLTLFQSMFLDPVLDISSPWFFVVVKKEDRLAFLPEVKHMWSYAPRMMKQGYRRFLYNGATRLTSLYDSCVRDSTLKMGINDGVDNDCDGIVDEEFTDNQDNDVDLKVDEDISSNVAICVMDYNYGVNPKPWIFMSASVIAVLISILIAILAVILFIGGNFLLEILQGGHPTRPSRVEPAE
ncbi:uncharacterized protein LOC126824349 [Patella vulgata]|uniref:uncharacterized protein LOC126824349 n=1 Tax=Patella vulgata TaxID=6465 RepID=UPI0024A90E34|nr:uncharacterized protein LOC126824349 [Patella vulgata]